MNNDEKLLVILVTFTYTLSAQHIDYCEYDATSGVMSNAQEFPANAVADDSQELVHNSYLVYQESFEVVHLEIH